MQPCAAQLTHTYTTGIRRNDHSVFHYGFVQEYDPPALVEQDLPGGNLYDVSPYSEADYGESLLVQVAVLKLGIPFRATEDTTGVLKSSSISWECA